MLYGRLDDLRDRASGRLSKVLLDTGGTPAARSERDAFVEMYSQRITQLDAAENGLCFGRLDLAEGDRRYIGRIGILDDASDYEALLVDWRAPAARPFYIATAFSPEGVLRRRHIRTRQRKVTGVDDEVLDVGPDGQASPDRAAGHAGLTGEAALIAALSATRTGRMADIVETIQAEQDLIIRSPHNGVTVVQGAPGTGKTAVALHRAAYLLYTVPRAAVPAGRADRGAEPDLPALHRARAPLAGRDRGADVDHRGPVPGDHRPPRAKHRKPRRSRAGRHGRRAGRRGAEPAAAARPSRWRSRSSVRS